MGQKLVIGVPFKRGLQNDVTAFNIDNNSFPTLQNAYQWRGRVKRKRGTSELCRLTRYFGSDSVSFFANPHTLQLDGSGNGNIISFYGLTTIVSIKQETLVVIGFTSGLTYTDDGLGNILNAALTIVGSINYVTGALSIPSEANNFIDVNYSYFPGLPVMGIEDFSNATTELPGTIAFDTKKSYNVSTTNIPTTSWNVNFYKNVPSGTYTDTFNPNVAKNRLTPFNWFGEDYQQFWTANYQGAMFTTNGIEIPFNSTNIGMSFVSPSSTTQNVMHGATEFTFVIPSASGVIANDFVFANEFTASGGGDATTLNLQTGYVVSISDAGPLRTIVVVFPYANITAGTYSGGILQLLTKQYNATNSNQDCIRWYDGDPTGGTNPQVTVPLLGWVNYQPPLSLLPYSIADLPPKIYYLVGARMIFPFRDRLLFIGPVVQTSEDGAASIYLQDTVIYSQNGTPYYTASFQGDPVLPTTSFTPIVVPGNPTPPSQVATPMAFICDQPGFGGWVQVGIDEKINTASLNENVLILGMDTHQVRMVYTSNDLNPFNFYFINSELGSSSTFSSINMDKGVMTRGNRGYVLTSQVETQRFDLDIPDDVFQIKTLDSGVQRFCSVRDFINEWVQFTYPGPSAVNVFPNSTLQYNYRDNSWAQYFECYTTYGSFKSVNAVSWGELPYSSWDAWNDPWDSGASNEGQPLVAAGNQQGFLVIKGDGEGTTEAPSLYISAISGNRITSTNHCLNTGDYIRITGCLGTYGSYLNNFTFQVTVFDNDNIDIAPLFFTGTYTGGGQITRLYIPFIQTKQFPASWEMARKTRLGPSMYLLTKTDDAQITLLIYLSQNAAFAYNTNPPNNSLIYNTVLYTCPESTNIGLTPANTNLQMVTASNQDQIWHRVSTSLIGDTIQLGLTISDEQMQQIEIVSGSAYSVTYATQSYPCVIDCIGGYAPNALIAISGVVGMEELNFSPAINNYYSVISSTDTQVTINIDSTAFGAFQLSPNALAAQYEYRNQEDEIELHGIIMDLNPSSLLS